MGQAFLYTSLMIMMFALRTEIRMHFSRWSLLGLAATSTTTALLFLLIQRYTALLRVWEKKSYCLLGPWLFLSLVSCCCCCCWLAACVCVDVCDSSSNKVAKWAPRNVYVDAKIMKARQMPRMPPNFLYSLWLSLFFFWWSYLAIAFFFLNCNLIYFSFCDFFLGY